MKYRLIQWIRGLLGINALETDSGLNHSQLLRIASSLSNDIQHLRAREDRRKDKRAIYWNDHIWKFEAWKKFIYQLDKTVKDAIASGAAFRDRVDSTFSQHYNLIRNAHAASDEIRYKQAEYRDEFNRLKEEVQLLKQLLKVEVEDVPAKESSIPAHRRLVKSKKQSRQNVG